MSQQTQENKQIVDNPEASLRPGHDELMSLYIRISLHNNCYIDTEDQGTVGREEGFEDKLSQTPKHHIIFLKLSFWRDLFFLRKFSSCAVGISRPGQFL